MSCPSPHIRFGQKVCRRESQVIGLIATGLADKQIGLRLGITPRTVKFHFTNAKLRLGALNRPHLVMRAVEDGIISPQIR
jgi:DNA-binding NarL/FixJ family response regulator